LPNVSGEVPRWRDLARQTAADLEAPGADLEATEMTLRLDTTARSCSTARTGITPYGQPVRSARTSSSRAREAAIQGSEHGSAEFSAAVRSVPVSP
jgi:hypothetical protein